MSEEQRGTEDTDEAQDREEDEEFRMLCEDLLLNKTDSEVRDFIGPLETYEVLD